MAQLQPQLSAVFAALSGKFPKTVKVGSLVENQIAGFLGITCVALHLTNYGYGQPTSGPTLIQPILFSCRVAGSITQGIRHCRFRNPVFQGYATGQF